MESGDRLTRHQTRYYPGTIKNYKGFLNQVQEFERNHNRKFKFNEIDSVFYDTFIDFFNHKNYSLNTVGRQIKCLKVIMRTAMEENRHQSYAFSLASKLCNQCGLSDRSYLTPGPSRVSH